LYELAELNAAFNFSNAEKIINDAFEVYNEEKAKLNADMRRIEQVLEVGRLMYIMFYLLCWRFTII
jgi:hypothetical protein